MSDQQPKLKLAFLGEGFPRGAVPLMIVASKLHALQQAVFHAAASVSNHTAERRGPWFNRYRSLAELAFVTSHHSDLTIEAELTVDPVLSEAFEVGLHAIDLLFDTAVAVQSDTLNQFESRGLSRYDKDYLVRALEGLMPNVGDQYQIRLENCRPDRHPPVIFDAFSRQKVRNYIAQYESTYDLTESEIIVGELIKIQVDAGEDKITVRSRQQDIDCYYGDSLRDQVANLIAGSLVQVNGYPTLDASQKSILKIHRVLDVEHISMEPLRIARFEYAGRVFALHSPIAVDIEYTDGLWVYHHSELNLWGYAARREDALSNLHEAFAYVYEDIAEESEDHLDSVACELRTKLRRLVRDTSGETHHA